MIEPPTIAKTVNISGTLISSLAAQIKVPSGWVTFGRERSGRSSSLIGTAAVPPTRFDKAHEATRSQSNFAASFPVCLWPQSHKAVAGLVQSASAYSVLSTAV
jgi:hypothetical protein